MKNINLISYPVQALEGTCVVPGDKSISHRSIIFGSIATGQTIVNGFLEGEDCIATMNAFRAMGVEIEGPVNQRVIIHGVGKWGLKKPLDAIDCGNSGTSMRLLAGLLSGQHFDSRLTGDDSLCQRPMSRISKPLTQMGAVVLTRDGKAPLEIKGGKKLHGIEYIMPEASAQVKSSLLLAGMYAEGRTTISQTGISRDHTERMLNAFLYPLSQSGNRLTIQSTGECRGTTIDVPGDISSAAFFIVGASIIPGANVLIRNVGFNPTRTGIMAILQAMGADITVLNSRQVSGEPVVDLQIRHAPLNGIDIPSAMVPLAIDEFPIVFIAAACAKGVTTLRGARELRLKESDRIGAMVDGLNQLGVDAKGFEDGVDIQGGTISGGVVDSRGDHRIAMSFAIAGGMAKGPVTIKNCAPVATSFPSFVKTSNTIKFNMEEVKDNV